MNYLKIQQELLKNMLKDSSGFMFGEHEDCIGVSEGHVIWLIPKICFMLDFEKMEKQNMRRIDISGMFKCDSSKYEDAVITSDLKTQGKMTFVKIKGENHKAWVDVALLKYFDNPQFRVSSPTSVLMVFEKEQQVGLVCPYRLKDGDDLG